MDIKTRLRDGAARMLFGSGITAPERRCQGRLTIVTFHRVLPEAERQAYPYPDLVVTPQELDAYLNYFTRRFDCGTLSIQHRRFLDGEGRSRPLLALTFDDGQFDNYVNARPVLAHHRVRASFFVPVAAVEQREPLWHDRLGFAVLALLGQPTGGKERLMEVVRAAGMSGRGALNLAENVAQESKLLPSDARLRLVEALEQASGTDPVPEFARLMTFEEIAELAANGHEIGSHSMTHRMMPECDDRALTYEVSESRRILEERIAQPVESFCYPNGDSDARSAQAVAKAGYRQAVTTRWGRNRMHTDRFRLRRCDMDPKRMRDSSGRFLPALLAFRMSGFYPGLG